MYREHPLKILKYSIKNIWLLIFPLLRGIWAMKLDVDKLYTWLKGAWFDILFILLIILFGCVKWLFSKIDVTESAIIHTNGIVIKTKTVIPYENISSITREHSFYLRCFKAVRFYADTCAGILKTPDMVLLLNNKVCEKIIGTVPQAESESSVVYRHKPKSIIIIFFSVLFSSSFSGVIYISAFFFQGGQIAKDLISESVDQLTAEASKFLIINIPYAVLTIVIVIMGAWIISFIINMVRYSGFFIRRYEHIIEIESGNITPRRFLLCQNKINYIYLKQNLLMKIFSVMSVNVNCSGYGTSKKKNLPVLLPVQTKGKFKENLKSATDIEYKTNRQYKPKITSFWQYIWASVIIAICIFPATRFLSFHNEQLHDAVIFITVMAEIPAVWYIIIRFAALLTSGVTIDGNLIYLRYSRTFSFYTLIAEKDKLAKAAITQSPFQKIFKKCSVVFYFNSEITEGHVVKALKLKDAQKILQLLME